MDAGLDTRFSSMPDSAASADGSMPMTLDHMQRTEPGHMLIVAAGVAFSVECRFDTPGASYWRWSVEPAPGQSVAVAAGGASSHGAAAGNAAADLPHRHTHHDDQADTHSSAVITPTSEGCNTRSDAGSGAGGTSSADKALPRCCIATFKHTDGQHYPASESRTEISQDSGHVIRVLKPGALSMEALEQQQRGCAISRD